MGNLLFLYLLLKECGYYYQKRKEKKNVDMIILIPLKKGAKLPEWQQIKVPNIAPFSLSILAGCLLWIFRLYSPISAKSSLIFSSLPLFANSTSHYLAMRVVFIFIFLGK